MFTGERAVVVRGMGAYRADAVFGAAARINGCRISSAARLALNSHTLLYVAVGSSARRKRAVRPPGVIPPRAIGNRPTDAEYPLGWNGCRGA